MVVGAKWAHLGSSETVDGLRFSHTTSVQRFYGTKFLANATDQRRWARLILSPYENSMHIS